MDRLDYRVAELYWNGGRITSELVAELCRNTQLARNIQQLGVKIRQQQLALLEEQEKLLKAA